MSRAEAGHDVGGHAVELVALVLGLADGVDDDVVAAGRAELVDLHGALLGGADDAVLLRERLEVLCVALRQELHPRRLRRLVVAADGDEGQMRRREVIELPPCLLRRAPDLVEALRVALRLDDVRHPPVALPSRTGQRGVRAAADPDGRPGPLHGLGIDRDAVEAREPPLEAGRRVAPERADGVDGLADARAPLTVWHAAELELLGVLAADPDAEDQPPARQHVEGARDLRRDGGRAQGEEVHGGAEADTAGDGGVGGEQRQRLVEWVVKGHVVARPHRRVAELLDAPGQLELLRRRMDAAQLRAEADHWTGARETGSKRRWPARDARGFIAETRP